jgi:hypothetical protein
MVGANGCEWNANICENAAHFGYLNILKWAKDNGCKWNVDACILATKNVYNHSTIKWIADNKVFYKN